MLRLQMIKRIDHQDQLITQAINNYTISRALKDPLVDVRKDLMTKLIDSQEIILREYYEGALVDFQWSCKKSDEQEM